MTNRLKISLRSKRKMIVARIFMIGALLFGVVQGMADDITVVEIRKNLLLDPTDISYKDYYLNGGAEVGLKEGMIVTLTRRLTLHNGPANKSVGDLVVPVGKLKIIFVQKRVSVARFFSTISRQNLPMLEYATVMIGDSVDLSTAAIEVSVKGSKEVKNDDENTKEFVEPPGIQEMLPGRSEPDTVASSMILI